MLVGILHIVKKRKERVKARTKRGKVIKASCILGEHCIIGKRIEIGQLHILIVQKNREGKRWYKRIHLECMSAWVEYAYEHRLKPMGGDHGGRRPPGKGPLSTLNSEAALERRRLVQKRARLFKRFLEDWHPWQDAAIWKQIQDIQKQITETGVPLQDKLQGHRSPEARARILGKAERLKLS